MEFYSTVFHLTRHIRHAIQVKKKYNSSVGERMSFINTLRSTDNKVIKSIRSAINDSAIGRKLIDSLLYSPNTPDREYISHLYEKTFGETPNLDNPKNFNEKINWIKLNDRKPLYTQMVDKYKAKSIIADRVGSEYAFPLIGVWGKPEDIDFDKLPNKFVLKPNHAGGVVICRDKATFNKKEAIRYLNQILGTNYYVRFREWAYKDVERKVICEQYMGEHLADYKTYCFNGKPLYTLVWDNIPIDEMSKPEPFFCGAYDKDWNRTGLEVQYPSKLRDVEKPTCHKKMLEIAEKLSKDNLFMRVDCYIIGDHVYVGEMTMYPYAGFFLFKNNDYNIQFGNHLHLPIDAEPENN